MAKSNSNPDELLQTSEAARLVGVSPPWLRDMANEGRIPTLRTAGGVRLFKRRDLEEYMDHRQKNPPTRGRPPKRGRLKTTQ